MGTTSKIRATADGHIPGVRVIGFHGRVRANLTPARRGAVYVDEQDRLLRIIEVRPIKPNRGGEAGGFDVAVEAAPGPIPREGPLPGVGTRVGPWEARLEDYVVVLGQSEIAIARELRPQPLVQEPPRVAEFVGWLGSNMPPSAALTCQRIESEKVTAWYCSKHEAHALWTRIRAVVEEQLFEAARSEKREDLERTGWWLSRVALGPEDIYRAGEALRRAGSLDWKVLLREGLRLPKEEDWKEGLEEAAELLNRPPRSAKIRVPGPAELARTGLRRRFGVAA